MFASNQSTDEGVPMAGAHRRGGGVHDRQRHAAQQVTPPWHMTHAHDTQRQWSVQAVIPERGGRDEEPGEG